MKKLLLVLAVLVTGAMMLSSCSSGHACPAYSKVHKVPAERPA